MVWNEGLARNCAGFFKPHETFGVYGQWGVAVGDDDAIITEMVVARNRVLDREDKKKRKTPKDILTVKIVQAEIQGVINGKARIRRKEDHAAAKHARIGGVAVGTDVGSDQQRSGTG
jgi:hypothetical protein